VLPTQLQGCSAYRRGFLALNFAVISPPPPVADDSLLRVASSRRPRFRAVASFYLAVIKDTSYLWMHFKYSPPSTQFFIFQKLVPSILYLHFLLDQSSVRQSARGLLSVAGALRHLVSTVAALLRPTHIASGGERHLLQDDAVNSGTKRASNLLKGNNIWSQVPEWARHQDVLTECQSQKL
jgi:hypothetical protein